MFFSGVCFILTYLHYCEDDVPVKLLGGINKEIRAKLNEVFNTTSHFSALKYVTTVSITEAQYFADTMLLLYSTF